MWKDVVVAVFKIFKHLAGVSKEDCENFSVKIVSPQAQILI
jgi:hypothetical protein